MNTAKAIIAFLGAMVTALLGLGVIPTEGNWHTILTIIAALATAFMTWRVPNTGYVSPPVIR